MINDIVALTGIRWSGELLDGMPKGDLTPSQRDTILLCQKLSDEGLATINLDTNPTAQLIKAKITAAQWTALQNYQATLKDEKNDELLEKLTAAFLKLVYQLGENGQALTAANLKPWRDKVKIALNL